MPVFSRFLYYFMAVAQHGSIRKASEDLRIAASAVDRQLLQGEKMLGTPLFERLPTGLRLTATGELFLTAGRRWVRDLDSLMVQIDDMKGLRRGKVDVLIPDALTKGFMPELIGVLRQTHPGILVNTHVRDNQDIGALLVEGGADFALMLDPGNLRQLVVRSHAEFPLGFISPPGHPITQCSPARFSLCAQFPMVLPAPPLALRRQIKLLEIETEITLTPVASANNIQMIKSLVLSGAGVGILSYLDVMHEVKSEEIAFTPIFHRNLSPLTLALCADRSRQLSAAARLIILEIEKIFLSGVNI
ncbi:MULTISPECIES: LysR family transcriptional regulator [Asaia]|uniref:LysR family transcriptional regulator n=1 Tax=Asaia TaxID=91914 RepID=UPI00255759B6|nr:MULTISPECIES: LysR family transcriptional regulator [Asaia]MDL2172541.1 LysR family transcriptional regulator [Asaia sp. HumB]MDR6184012.1 DNA-binding transcriptional LysR family regulator [Asaia bogorensis NBRC 16594]